MWNVVPGREWERHSRTGRESGLGTANDILVPCKTLVWTSTRAVAEMGLSFGHNRRGPKIGGCASFFLGGGAGSPSNTICLGRRLPSYQVALRSIQPFRHNRHGVKIGGCAPLGRGSWVSNTMWPTGPTSMPGFILIHPTVWPQYTNVIQTDRQRNGRTVLQTVAQKTIVPETPYTAPITCWSVQMFLHSM